RLQLPPPDPLAKSFAVSNPRPARGPTSARHRLKSTFFTDDYITLRGRNDAGDALRSSAEHAAFEEMVLAQGLGHADRQAPRDEEGDRGLRVRPETLGRIA